VRNQCQIVREGDRRNHQIYGIDRNALPKQRATRPSEQFRARTVEGQNRDIPTEFVDFVHKRLRIDEVMCTGIQLREDDR